MHPNSSTHILVTGAAGFIGSHLCDALLPKGYRVTGVDNLSFGSLDNLTWAYQHQLFDFQQKEIQQLLKECDQNIDVIVHLASKKIPRYDHSFQTIDENIRNTQAVVEFAIKSKSRLLFASTSDVYGKNTITPYHEESDLVLGSSTVKRWAYAASKIASEHLILGAAQAHDLSAVIFRFFGTYGPRQHRSWWGGPQSVFIDQVLQNEPIEIHGDGQQVRSFVYIDDLINGIVQTIDKPEIKGIYNLCTKPCDAVSIKQLACQIHKLIRPNETIKIKYIPYSTFGRYEDVMRRTGLFDKAQNDFGFMPQTDLITGLLKTIEWHRSVKG
ncbi:MAG: NAD-dependent epimerase/dehydratase family protein [Flavobacteriales bacterium]